MFKKPRWRTVLVKHPISLVFGVMALGLILLSVLFFQAEMLERRHFSAFSQKQMTALIAQQQQWLTRNTRDYAIWDDIAEQLAGDRHDPKWLASNFTESIYRNLEIGEVLILDTALKPVYYLHDGLPTPLAQLEDWSPELLARLRGRSFQSVMALSYTGFFWRDETCYLIAIERIRAEHPETAKEAEPAGWLIFARRLDISWKEGISHLLSISDLQVWNERPPATWTSFPLPDLYISGSHMPESHAAWLSWRVAGVSDANMRRLLGPGFWLSLALFLFGLLWLVRGLLRQQKEQLRQQERVLQQAEILRQLAQRPLLHYEDEARRLSEMTEALSSALRLSRVSIWFWNDTRWECLSEIGVPDMAHPLLEADEAFRARLQESKTWSCDLAHCPLPAWRHYLLRHEQSRLLMAGIVVADKPAGVLLLESDAHEEWDSQAQHFAISAAELAGSLREAARRSRNHAAARQHSFFDTLTGLACRERLMSEITTLLARKQGLVFALISLDALVQINEEYGYASGDQVLQTLAQRLWAGRRNLASRLSADRFVLVLPSDADTLSAQFELEQTMAELCEPILLGEHSVQPKLACGVSIALQDAGSFEELLQHAEFALETARSRGNWSIEYYAPEINARVQRRQQLLQDLPDAFARGELILHYQPVIDLARDEIAGAEVSPFWAHSELGLLAASEFLAQSCRIKPCWMQAEACLRLVEWRQQSGRPLWVMMPVHASQLAMADWVSCIADLLAAHALPAEALHLSLTEAEIAALSDVAWANLAQLQGLGVCIVICLRQGQVALNQLYALKPARLKYVAEDDESKALNGLHMLAQTLETPRQIEGLMSAEQVRQARTQRCDYGQGAFFCRSVSQEEFRLLLSRWVCPSPDQGS